jgi:arylformamidase
VAYGEGADEKLDLYFPAQDIAGGPPQPIHLFVHGGYWRSFSKEDYAFVADAITASGAIAALVGYSLLPGARMDVLVAQVRRAAVWLADHAAEFGGDPHAISVSGHSAGAHLASLLVSYGPHERPGPGAAIRSALLVSGVYDLAPIARSALQAELRLTDEEVARWSPLAGTPMRGTEVALLVGSAETAPFHEQGVAFSDYLNRAGLATELSTMAGEDHMTIVRELGRPGSAVAGHLARTIAASRRAMPG